MIKKILAVVLVFAFAFAFAACGDKDSATVTKGIDPNAKAEMGDKLEETRPANLNAPTAAPSAPVENATEIVTKTDESGNVVTEVVTVAPSEVPTEAPTEAKKDPEGKEEIVAYFNDAINGVKPNAKSIKHHYSAITLNGSTTVPGAIDVAMKALGGTDKFIGDQLAKNSKGEQTYTGADIKAHFPVEGEDYASKLTADDVASAKIGWTTDGNYDYVIDIVLKDDAKSSSVKHGQGHAPKAFNVVLPGIVNENVPGVAKKLLGGAAEMNYPACSVRVVVDYETGRVLSAIYKINWTINFGDNIIIPFTTTDLYEIQY